MIINFQKYKKNTISLKEKNCKKYYSVETIRDTILNMFFNNL
jgi:hypothetical protein